MDQHQDTTAPSISQNLRITWRDSSGMADCKARVDEAKTRMCRRANELVKVIIPGTLNQIGSLINSHIKPVQTDPIQPPKAILTLCNKCAADPACSDGLKVTKCKDCMELLKKKIEETLTAADGMKLRSDGTRIVTSKPRAAASEEAPSRKRELDEVCPETTPSGGGASERKEFWELADKVRKILHDQRLQTMELQKWLEMLLPKFEDDGNSSSQEIIFQALMAIALCGGEANAYLNLLLTSYDNCMRKAGLAMTHPEIEDMRAATEAERDYQLQLLHAALYNAHGSYLCLIDLLLKNWDKINISPSEEEGFDMFS